VFAEHDLLTTASAIAFRTLVALVALALLLLGLLGLGGREELWAERVGPAIEPHLLPAVYDGIDATAQRVFRSGPHSVVALASMLALWDVSSAVRACMTSLNRIYDAKETRSWWVRLRISLLLAAVIIVAAVGSFLLLVGAREAVSGGWAVPFAVGRWLAAIVALGLAVGLLVRFAPAERRAKKWATAGTALVIGSWLITSLIFAWFVTSVANFKSAVGTLAVLFVLTAYLYTLAIAFLVGVQVDEFARKHELPRPQ
jgi:membrane protein